MRFLRLVGLFLLTFVPAALALDREAFTFTKYDLEIHVNPSSQSLAAKGKVTLRNDSSQPQRNVIVQISSTLAWNAIRLAGKPVQFLTQPYTSDIDHTGALSEAIVTLPVAVLPHSSIELEIEYVGTITIDATRLTRVGTPAEAALRSDWDQIGSSFTAVRGIGHVAWYPVALDAQNFSEGKSLFQAVGEWKARHSRSSMSVNICWSAASSLSVVANGELEGLARRSSQQSGEVSGCSPYRFAPIGLTVPTFAIANYASLDRPGITVLHLPDHKLNAEDWIIAAQKLEPFATEWFGKWVGKVRIVEVPQTGAVPFESGPMLFTPLDLREKKAIELEVVHELAHASLGSPRPWISEGLAHFAQVLEREQQDGRQVALQYMGKQLPALVEAEKLLFADNKPSQQGMRPPGQPLVTATDELFYRTKAMHVWWMLRDMLGDRPLQRALAAYRPDQDREPSYIQRLLEKQSKRNLEWFFDDWVYRDRGLPDFHVQSAYPRELLAGGYLVTVTVKNSGAAGAEVPVLVRASAGDVIQRVLVPAAGTAISRLQVPAQPVEVVVNDGSVPETNTSNNSLKVEVKQ